MVEAKTKLKDMKTVRGRLGPVTADGFEIQTVNGQKVDTVKLSFADVKSVGLKSQSRSHTWIYVVVTVGVIIGALIGLAYATGLGD